MQLIKVLTVKILIECEGHLTINGDVNKYRSTRVMLVECYCSDRRRRAKIPYFFAQVFLAVHVHWMMNSLVSMLFSHDSFWPHIIVGVAKCHFHECFFPAIRISFIQEYLTFQQFMKVFTCEKHLLYGMSCSYKKGTCLTQFEKVHVSRASASKLSPWVSGFPWSVVHSFWWLQEAKLVMLIAISYCNGFLFTCKYVYGTYPGYISIPCMAIGIE